MKLGRKKRKDPSDGELERTVGAVVIDGERVFHDTVTVGCIYSGQYFT